MWHKKEDSKSEQKVKACKEQTEQQDWRAAEGLFRAEAKTTRFIENILKQWFYFLYIQLRIVQTKQN